jgi:nitroreductase
MDAADQGSSKRFLPLEWLSYSPEDQMRRSREFLELFKRRRSVRHFSDRPVSRELLETVIRTAATAPSGANKQPWKFVLVDDPELKRLLREAAEEEERRSYERRMPRTWLEDLEPMGTDWKKEFLEVAPFLIVVFKEKYGVNQRKHYYVEESVGIACGFLLAAIHYVGLASLTHTPSPMGFLTRILRRPENETPYLVIPVGYPAEGAVVPDIARKPLGDVLVRNRDPEGADRS